MPTKCKDYNFQDIERHWQSFWEENRSFRSEIDESKSKYYVLDMFPYPSGTGLHVGHPLGYIATDIISRFKRAQGYNVLHPMGWDAFGLPAEQHAVKTGQHPDLNTRINIATFKSQINALGLSYDWDREISTTNPDYFRWTQWIFLLLFKRGLAYVDERPVWWCPELRTVLANEEVVDGKSDVGNFPVERRNLRQWVLRITAYAERLLADLKDVNWPDSTKRMQEAWIGRSEGAEISFALEPPEAGFLKVFTTRPDTLFGCTYMVLAPEHPLVATLTLPPRRSAVEAYRKQAAAKSDLERTDLAKDKSGVFSGSFAINPINGARVPIWIADYVLMGYGTGAIMAVPAHDERDHAFAVKYSLPIVRVIAGENGEEALPFTGDGSLVHSPGYNGLPWAEAKRRITAQLTSLGSGKATVNYKLRDWLFSRQRYWGEPFPIVWVSKADYERAASLSQGDLPANPVHYTSEGRTRYALPIPKSALPLQLPAVQSYLPSGDGESPLANVSGWVDIWFDFATGRAKPASNDRPPGETWIRAHRETNTMPQWAGSCWYYIRFVSPKYTGGIASPEALKYWGSPDLYLGGAEHAVLHLLYSRFWHKVLFDAGIVPNKEPFPRLFHQGMMLGEDGEKMSKSRGNVENPDDIIASHGADTLRLYEMFLGPLEAMKPWNTQGIAGVHRFLQKLWRKCIGEDGKISSEISETAMEPVEVTRLLHETIKKVGEDIENLRFNTAISQMMTLMNALQKLPGVRTDTIQKLLKLLAPFAPHIAEELWERLNDGLGLPRKSIQDAGWPQVDPAQLETQSAKLVFQVNGKHRGDAMAPVNLPEPEAVAMARAHPRVALFLAGKTIKKAVYVPNRILNLVTED